MPIIFSFFHPIKGPSQMFIIPEDEAQKDGYREITKLLDFVEKKGFFVHSFENFKTANYYFEIPSDWARGKREMALVSVVFEKEGFNSQIFQIPLSEFVIELLSIKDIYKGFYINTPSNGDANEIQAKNTEIKALLENLFKVLPKSIVSIKKKSLKLFVFGLDRAGKTSILERLKRNEFVQTKRTLNLNLLNFVLDNVNLICWDLGGQIGFRKSWQQYLKEPDVLIYVIDLNDKERYKEAKEELWKILNFKESKNIPLLILANKKDLAKNVQKKAIVKELGLSSINDRKWALYKTSARTGEGIINGFQWIFKNILKENKVN
ncbi:MAG: ADP-ribosylation factor family protein [Candidatus Helarchaeota archaeon]